jgi:hypothetical protein
MLRYDLNDKRFVTTANEHGVSGADTIFHYFSDGLLITGSYKGGRILEGQLIGKATSENTIEMRYQCVTIDGELLSGACTGEVSSNDRALIELHLDWWWLTGRGGGGESSYMERR